MKGLNRFFLLSLLFVVPIGIFSAYAQVDYSTATLRGTVLDPQGAVIAAATVTVTNPSTGITKTAKTGADGSYHVPALPPGTYQITVEAPGFTKELTKGIELTVGQIQVYDARMKVGSAIETLEVSADNVPLIQTEQTQQANTINQLQVTELPNINHDITQQVYTLPGVANANSPRAQTPGFTGFGTTGFSIGGSNGRNNLSTIDGGENEYGTGQYRVTTIPQDTIQEYQVNRAGFAAEYGFTDGSAINIVTKSGGNQFHGGAYGEFQNHTTSAQNFFNGIEGLPSAYSQNVYTGFTVGGPIKQDKLFFFLAYEYRSLNNPSFGNANVLGSQTVITGPTPAEIAYLNANLPPAVAGQFAFLLTPLHNPTLNKILTAENGIFNNPFRYHNTLLRFDGQPNSNNSVNLRLEYSHDDSNVGNPDGAPLLTRDFSILGTWNHSFSSSLLNQALVQLVPRNVANNVPNSPFQGVNFTLGSAGSFGSSSLIPYLAHQQRYQFEDNLTWNRGAHSFKVGASARLANYNVEDDLWFNNQFDFRDGAIPLALIVKAVNPGAKADPSNSLLTAPQAFNFGVPVDVLAGNLPSVAGPSNPKWTGWGKYIGGYVQDSWKLNSRLTLNGGVRFDSDGEPPPLSSSFYVSPRLGLAWDPFGDQKTVIRASGGVFVAPVDVLIPSYGSLLDGSGRYINEVLAALPSSNIPKLWQIGIAKGELPFGHLTAADFAAAGINTLPLGATVGYSVNPNYKNPYSVQGSFSIDRQLGKSYSLEVGYNMYHGVHLQMPLETAYAQINPGNAKCPTPACTDITGGPLYIPVTGQLQHTTYESIGSSIYHGLTTSLTKRYTHGLQFQVNYTFSKSIDNVIDFASFQNWFRPSRLDLFRTTSVFDVPHLVVANAVYTTPFKPGTGNFFNTMLADIVVAPIVTWRSGLPFSVRTPSLANGIALDNTFAMPFNSSRDNNRGPAFATTDLTLKKSFYINRERGVHLDLSATGTNIFNRVNFNKVSDQFDINGIPPNGIVQTADGPLNLFTGPYTGLHGVKPNNPNQINQPLFFSSADLPRQLQFGLKLVF